MVSITFPTGSAHRCDPHSTIKTSKPVSVPLASHRPAITQLKVASTGDHQAFAIEAARVSANR